MEGSRLFIMRPVCRFIRIVIAAACSAVFCSSVPAYAWELAKQQDDVTVHTRRVEGSSFREYRAVMELETSLSSLVAIVGDTEAYPAWIHTCTEGRVLEKINEKQSYNYTVNGAPWPVSDRDAIVLNTVRQNSQDGIVIIHIKGVPDYIPEKPGRVRVKKIEGYWRFTPLGNGLVRVEYQVHSEPGGSLPSWLVNSVVVEQPFYTLIKMKEMVKRPKYRDASFDFIKETTGG